MTLFERFRSAKRVWFNEDLIWVGRNLAPRMVADLRHTNNGFAGRNGNDRGFVFAGHDVNMQIRWEGGHQCRVSLRRMDLPDLNVSYRVLNGRPRGAPNMSSSDISDDAFYQLTAYLRAFGEAYLAEPLSRFNYATPGEYLEWPDRDLIEPPRDPSAIPMDEVDASIDRKIRELRLSVRLGKDDAQTRKAAEAEINDLNRLRHEALAKTTHGRWMGRHKPEMDRQWDAYVAGLVVGAVLDAEAGTDDPSPLD